MEEYLVKLMRMDFVNFKIKIDSQSFEVKKIGVRLVYRQDIEDPYQTKALCINNNNMFL